MQLALPSTKVRTARAVGLTYHGNQKYGEEFGYGIHLTYVEGVLLRFGIVDEDLRAMAYVHDTLEDTNLTYEALEAYCGVRVAQGVKAVTEPKGSNRAWRHSVAYPEIRKSLDARILKLADRIANVEVGGGKVDMYVKEHPDFRRALYVADDPPVVQAMWDYLGELLAAAGRANV
jgi:(p)ppGpp synthase/HD superfamily hydrolase